MIPSEVEYILYLVTDSSVAVLGQRDLFEVVEKAVRAGVTIVQYREKHKDTAELIETARKLHEITQRYDIPLLINDRVDVAMAVEAEGVHLGQDDMSLPLARKLLGPDAIIGATVSNVMEARRAVKEGATYLGIGTVYPTETKKNSKAIIGPIGVQAILADVVASGNDVPCVAIGGINVDTAPGLLFRSQVPSKVLDGVAVVSALIAAQDPFQAARDMHEAIAFIPNTMSVKRHLDPMLAKATERIPQLLVELRRERPLCHNMTNLVVQNFAANVCLCVGASPIMANYGAEAADLAKLQGALVVNMGTVTPEGLANYKQAVAAYNAAGAPVVLDPVGCAATAIRRAAVKDLMLSGYYSVIKGNESEICQVLDEAEYTETVNQKGVDSGISKLEETAKVQIVSRLAAREHNVVLMTGKTDYLSDGTLTLAIDNGNEMLGNITGSGCCLGSVIAAFLAVCKSDRLLAAFAGTMMYEIAAELVMADSNRCKGPGTFVPAFLDMLKDISDEAADGKSQWLSHMKWRIVASPMPER